jgi:AcrR family transcriptional regulator
MHRRPSTLTRQRKARQQEERRSEILAAARKVFARRGYEAATLDEIAHGAAYAKGTLYNYFSSKQDLFQQTLSTLLDDISLLATSVARDRGSARERFHRFACGMMDYYRGNEDFLRIVTLEMNRMQLEEKQRARALLTRLRAIGRTLGRTLEQDIRSGQVVTDNPLELAQVFVALIHNRIMRRSFERGGLRAMDTRRDADFLTRLFFDGIAHS